LGREQRKLLEQGVFMNSINILVVDDEIEICNLIKSALKKQGYAVTVRNNAIDISKEELNKFDLILLDVMMPTVDGFTLCRYIRDEVDCPIIFITAKTMEEDILEGFSIGADDYIKKPFSILELRARVEAHLRREHREKQQVLSTNELKFNLKSSILKISCTDFFLFLYPFVSYPPNCCDGAFYILSKLGTYIFYMFSNAATVTIFIKSINFYKNLF
jgi:CheY-like chemotaxis protein